ncbi:hypothetical protein [Aurantimonas endophytica]|uniref:Uncharacterized protein n=1 Tax=Aurantimonas endophytica TaxID=1522175 RepID=A0A7W6HCR7_9HYPH|nr:hypothetical protein [Aurantimonas endophytica]MBB4002641.1 hypothetical protein [Aurantimonas endophytica]MCO6403521.1 hypothetical protein [Aurantimonas endophytica]
MRILIAAAGLATVLMSGSAVAQPVWRLDPGIMPRLVLVDGDKRTPSVTCYRGALSVSRDFGASSLPRYADSGTETEGSFRMSGKRYLKADGREIRYGRVGVTSTSEGMYAVSFYDIDPEVFMRSVAGAPELTIGIPGEAGKEAHYPLREFEPALAGLLAACAEEDAS